MGLVFVLALGAVGLGLWQGWSGERTGDVVYLKPMGAVEAALLLEAGKAWIPQVDKDEAVVYTNQQLFPARGSDAPELVLSSGTRKLWAEPIASGTAFVRHRIRLRALEHALDDPNVGQYVERRPEIDAHGRGTPIYASNLLWLYGVYEVTLLVAFFGGLLAAVTLPRRRALIAPAVAGVLALFLLAVQLYEPAFLAHDFLRHRIVVDRIALGVLAVAPAALVLALVSVVGKLGQLAVSASSRRTQKAGALLAVLAFLGAAAAGYVSAGKRDERALERVATKVAALDLEVPPAIELIALGRHVRRSDAGQGGELIRATSLPPATQKFVAALEGARIAASRDAQLAVALTRGAAMQLGGADVPEGFVRIVAAESVGRPKNAARGQATVGPTESKTLVPLLALLDGGEPYRTNPLAFARALFLQGEFVQATGRPLALFAGDDAPSVAALVERRSGLARVLSRL